MGELIKKMGVVHIGDSVYDVELNEPQYPNGERIIHIQNAHGRLALSETNFFKMSTLILLAKDHIQKYKGL